MKRPILQDNVSENKAKKTKEVDQTPTIHPISMIEFFNNGSTQILTDRTRKNYTLKGENIENPCQNLSSLLKKIPTVGNGVAIGKSSIKNAGYGLFAQKDFKENEIVTYYHGLYIEDLNNTWDGINDDDVSTISSHIMRTLNKRYLVIGNVMLDGYPDFCKREELEYNCTRRSVIFGNDDNKKKETISVTTKEVKRAPLQLQGKGGLAYANDPKHDEKSSKHQANVICVELYDSKFVSIIKNGDQYDSAVRAQNNTFTPENVIIIGIATKSINMGDEIFINYNIESRSKSDDKSSTINVINRLTTNRTKTTRPSNSLSDSNSEKIFNNQFIYECNHQPWKITLDTNVSQKSKKKSELAEFIVYEFQSDEMKRIFLENESDLTKKLTKDELDKFDDLTIQLGKLLDSKEFENTGRSILDDIRKLKTEINDLGESFKGLFGVEINRMNNRIDRMNQSSSKNKTTVTNTSSKIYYSQNNGLPNIACRYCLKRPTFICSQCKNTFYCSKLCQSNDIQFHHKNCINSCIDRYKKNESMIANQIKTSAYHNDD